jgi:hypothetical protein
MLQTLKKIAVAGVFGIASVSAVQAQDFGPYTTSQSLDFIRAIADADYVKNIGPLNARGAYFEDLYEINLTQVSDFSYSITEITTGNNAQYDVTFMNYGFYDANGEAVTTLTNLAAGTYFLSATGKLAGSLGGDFNVSFNINPIATVPEADSYALMLAGLGLMGLVSRRKAK